MNDWQRNVELDRVPKMNGTFSATRTKSTRREPEPIVRRRRVSGRRRAEIRRSTWATQRELGWGKPLFSTRAGPLMAIRLIGSCTSIVWTMTMLLMNSKYVPPFKQLISWKKILNYYEIVIIILRGNCKIGHVIKGCIFSPLIIRGGCLVQPIISRIFTNWKQNYLKIKFWVKKSMTNDRHMTNFQAN